MNLKKLTIEMAIATTVCLVGPKLVLASGQAKPITLNVCNSGSMPGPLQVFVYDIYLNCWTLELNSVTGNRWGGYDTSDGLPNDAIQYAKVGSNVRVKFFWNWFYTHDEGGAVTLTSNPNFVYLGTPMAGNASAARVESTLQPSNCAATYEYLSIWDSTGAPTNCDCTMLYATTGSPIHYGDANKMAFRNDNMSSFINYGAQKSFYNDSLYTGWLANVPMYTTCMNAAYLPSCGITTTPSNIDNKVSSIY